MKLRLLGRKRPGRWICWLIGHRFEPGEGGFHTHCPRCDLWVYWDQARRAGKHVHYTIQRPW